jgi:hypothetical protein
MKERTKFWILIALFIASVALLLVLQHGANTPALFQ